MSTTSESHYLQASVDGKPSTLVFDDAALCITDTGRNRSLFILIQQVLWAEHSLGFVILEYLLSTDQGMQLARTTAQIDGENHARATPWVDGLLNLAYKGLKRQRKLRVLINPASGKGKGPQIFDTVVRPILKAARCQLDTTFTTKAGHAVEIARELPLDDYDAVLCLSGDGLVHEVINGLAEHASPAHALRTPLAPIPTGSGNAICLNLFGLKSGFDIATATLNAIKGSPMPTDIFSCTLADRRILSILSQTIGFLADADLDTEHLRWMGDARFVWGVICATFWHKKCPIKLFIEVEQHDKHEIVKTYDKARKVASTQSPPWHAESVDQEPGRFRPLHTDSRDPDAADSSWIAFNEPVLTVTAGQGPYISRDLMLFPASMPHDGLIDLAVWKKRSRIDILKPLIGGADQGEGFWSPIAYCYKAHAFCVRPDAPGIRVSIDGEAYDIGREMRVEVHHGLARLLSMQNHFAPHFTLRSRKQE